MRIAYFDASAGASGDMILGSLVAAGLDLGELTGAMAGLAVEGWRLEAMPVTPHGFAATKVTVHLDDQHHHPHRHLSHIVDILGRSPLSDRARSQATAIFTRLAAAEAKVHGSTVDHVHFHEVGAVDAIVDVVGAVVGLERLGVEQVACSPLPISHGWVDCAHGRLPVPAPGTLELLQGVPTRSLDVEGEVLTPTGAAILTTLATSWEAPAMTLERVGYGAGQADFGIPNVLRLLLGETASTPAAVCVIEANLDDMNPEWYDRAVERLFAVGAMDVTLSPLQMKKGRPGVLLRVLGEPSQRDALTDVVLRETTTLGVRWHVVQRDCLARDWVAAETPYGPVRVKIGRRGQEVLQIAPEYESCRGRAEATGAPLAAIYAAAREAARVSLTDPAGRHEEPEPV